MQLCDLYMFSGQSVVDNLEDRRIHSCPEYYDIRTDIHDHQYIRQYLHTHRSIINQSINQSINQLIILDF